MVNATLPIHDYRTRIMDTIRDNPVTIVVAETGSGKTTQIPQYLLEEEYRVLVTQPRRFATRTVSMRVAEEFGTTLGDVVGFRTAYERQDSAKTRCCFVTDGLALVHELMGVDNHDVLMIDELHEWNINIEVLVAWVKLQLKCNRKFKVVLTSATLEAERLSEHFDGAPIIDVPGRTYPVKEMPRGISLEDDTASALRQGYNVLVFQPGKTEIARTISKLQEMGVNAEILPLDGEMPAEEQDKCLRSYSRPKCIVSTNVAQTSITIPDIDVVVDSGTERRKELVDGIEVLVLGAISLADRKQRKGRAGRTKDGMYYDWCPEPLDKRREFPEAEILRVLLDQTVLRLAEAGLNMEELPFFHQPNEVVIHEARESLVALGCMDDDGRVTDMGRRIARMPISVKYGRMIIEAEKRGVVDDIITIAAILEQNGIVARVCPTHQSQRQKYCGCWKLLASGEDSSDVLAQLRVYHACKKLAARQMREAGVHVKKYHQARQQRRHLADALRGMVQDFQSSGDRQEILRSVCAGMVHHLYRYAAGQYVGADDLRRKLSFGSAIVEQPAWIVGEPIDVEGKSKYGETFTTRLVCLATKIEVSWLIDVAPELIRVETGMYPYYNTMLGEVMSVTETRFNGVVIHTEEVKDPRHARAAELRREAVHYRLWQAWTQPHVDLPNPADPRACIPPVVTAAYGVDAKTGEALQAYGTVRERTRYTTLDPWFQAFWTRDREEAERQRQIATGILAVAQRYTQVQANRRAEQEKLQDKQRKLRDEVNAILVEYGDHLDDELCRRLDRYDIDDALLPQSPVAADYWLRQAGYVLADARQFIARLPKVKTSGGVSNDALSALKARFNR